MKKLLLFSLLFFLFQTSYSQTWQWVEHQGFAGTSYARFICVDDEGNCYAAGDVSSKARIFKYTSLGDSVWSVPLWNGRTKAIVSDKNGYLYVSGDTSSKTGLAKIDTSGNIIWKVFDTVSTNTGIVFATTGHLYLTGNNDFLSKHDTSGNKIWARVVNATPNSIALDPFGNLCITGSFNGTAVFGTDTLISLGSGDIFVAKYDTSGTCIWAKRAGGNHLFGGYSKDSGYGITVDQIGNIYFTGSLVDTADFDSITIFGLGSGNDIFLAKYNSAGNALWVKHAHGGIDEEGRCIAIDHLGNILIGGSYVPTANFDGFLLPGWGNYDAFVAKYDNAGNFITAINAGGPSWNEIVYGIATDNSGNVFVTGVFCNLAYFGPHVVSTGGSNMFIAKIDLTTGIETHTMNPIDIAVYPNPASTNITIEFEMQDSEDVELEIKNVLGQSIYFQKSFLSGRQKQEVDISSLQSGFYLLELRSGKTFNSKKFIKQ